MSAYMAKGWELVEGKRGVNNSIYHTLKSMTIATKKNTGMQAV